MRRRAGTAALLVVALAVTGAATAVAQPPARGGDWLDRPPAAWNQPGAPLPRAPEGREDGENRESCEAVIRLPTSDVDRALTDAGWFLFGSIQGWGDAVVLMANAAWDGMCRPWRYQFFVFVGGRFAGTLSPVLMDARTDGAGQRVALAPRASSPPISSATETPTRSAARRASPKRASRSSGAGRGRWWCRWERPRAPWPASRAR